MTERLITIRTPEGLQQLVDAIQGAEYLAFDTETVSTDYNTEIIGFSVSPEPETGFYVILSYWDPVNLKLVDTGMKEASKAVIQALVGKSLILHNSIFDCEKTLYNFGIDLMPSVHTDTILLAQLLDENRMVGLKELAVGIFGEDSRAEQLEMKASVAKNGGVLTKALYELYKADPELIAKYGAKDTILTLKLFYHLIPQLLEQGLDKFFYDEETMPLLRTATYALNTVGLKVDTDKLKTLKGQLQVDIGQASEFIRHETAKLVADKYPGTSKVKTFNIGAPQQLSWLMFEKLKEDFGSLTDGGRDLCTALNIKIPYYPAARRQFVATLKAQVGQEYVPSTLNPLTGKKTAGKKVKDPWTYMKCDADILGQYASKYKWCAKLLEMKKNEKILGTYVENIEEKMHYGIIRPQFLQFVTTSGRYSSKNPNFTNLPAGDKRVKSCIVSRPGRVFVGGDWEQIEPRIFASLSGDVRLLNCFASGDDFYSVIGSEVLGKTDCTLKKDGSPDSFPVKYKKLRDLAKVIALAIPYGTTAPQLKSEMQKKAGMIKEVDECQSIIDDYLEAYPSVKELMLSSHNKAKNEGEVTTIFGRKRRLPEGPKIQRMYNNMPHPKLPAVARNVLNQAMNFPIQGAAASILNRTLIAFHNKIKELGISDCNILLCVHDEIVAECLEADAEQVKAILKDCMENTVTLPGVALVATPVIAKSLADLK